MLRRRSSASLTSLVIATPIMLFELKGERIGSPASPAASAAGVYFAIKVLFYFVVIVGGLMSQLLF